MKKIFKGIREKEQGNKSFTESISLWVDKSISSLRFLSLESRSALPNRQLNWLDCFAFARNDVGRHPEGDTPKDLSTNYKQEPSPEFVSSPQLTNKFYPLTGREGKQESVKNLFPYFPISLSLKKKFAFTLAEVLITLGIIGVVAAMTIPTLISNYQKKQTVTKLQKAISVINQAYRLAYDDVGEATPQEAFDMGTSKYFEKYWAPYLKVSLYCTSMSQCGYKENQPYRHKNISRQAEVYMVSPATRTTFYTPDGFLYVVMVSGGSTLTAQSAIWVDINGVSKPNVFGKDLFILRRKIDGEKGGVVVPDCYDKTDDYVNSECLNGNNFCCAEKIKRAGWKIDKSYQWK